MSDYIKIMLSDRAPVRIVEAEWPIIAVAERHDQQLISHVNRGRTIRVRAHADGRRIVEGWFSTRRPDERGTRAGYLLPAGAEPEEVASAIKLVATALGDAALGAECINDLPAERI